MTMLQSYNPKSGSVVEEVVEATTADEVNEIVGKSATAAHQLRSNTREFRARLLRTFADEFESHRDEIVAIADRETAIGQDRLNGELTRTAFQARLFADVLDEGSYLEAIIDHARETPMGPGPDLRRMLYPIGPVAVFGSSNFPLAFSVPGGDTVSAIAAGCPVVIKAHTSHPATSKLTFSILESAGRRVGAPDGTFGIVFGQAAGSKLVADDRIKAVAFTGSLGGGRALLDIINQRPEPIPFYGELASINPVVVTSTAAGRRYAGLATGIVNSVTMGAGQLCTKPGLVFIPDDSNGDALENEIVRLFSAEGEQALLNRRVFDSYESTTPANQGVKSVQSVHYGEETSGHGYHVTPRLISVTADDLHPESVAECFGPTTILVRYRSVEELQGRLTRLASSLTFTIHSEAEDAELTGDLCSLMMEHAGRILFDTYPTGVLVSWAQTHGGPWPATNTIHTSVGTTAIRRFLRPITWQSAPESVLPPELREADPGIPRRIDGTLVTP